MKLYDDKNTCCGCSMCKHICPIGTIYMTTDEEGFIFPAVDANTCLECGLCEAICTIKSFDKSRLNTPIKVVAFKHGDDTVRKASTSGGIFSALAIKVLENDGVVYGAAFDGFARVKHSRIDKISQLDLLRGSKYVQSSLDDCVEILMEDLLLKRRVLFSGTACQVDAVRRLAAARKISENTLITCDIICHGVASPQVYADYISFLEKKHRSKLISYKFRSKEISWRGSSCCAKFQDGSKINNKPEVCSYMNVYYSGNIMRESCYNCPYASTNRLSDITIGDYWGIENICGSFEDKLGVSMVMLNTEKGEKLFLDIQNCSIIEGNLESAKQPNLYHSCERPIQRERFWIEYKGKGISYILKKYGAYGIKHKIYIYYNAIKKKIGV